MSRSPAALWNSALATDPIRWRIPSGWRLLRFHEVAEIDGGLVSPLDEHYSEMPHIGPENIETDTGRILGVTSARALGLTSGKYLFDADAIVYSKVRPNLNKVCTPGVSGLCSADAYVVRPHQSVVVKEYLAAFMRSRLFVEQAVAVSMRTGMPKINQPDLRRLFVLLPPLGTPA